MSGERKRSASERDRDRDHEGYESDEERYEGGTDAKRRKVRSGSSGEEEPEGYEEAEGYGDGGGDGDGDGPPVLTEAEIAALDIDEVFAALDERDDGVGGETEDQSGLEFRRDALELLTPVTWITSVLAADSVLGWLGTFPGVVTDLSATVTARRAQLAAPPVPPLTPEQRQAVWTHVAAHITVPARALGDGCEYLAHAVCEAVDGQFPDVSRARLAKLWVVADSGILHPPEKWGHHVAPVLDCADGEFVLDPLLSPHTPLARDAWLAQVRGAVQAARAPELRRAWEPLGCPRQAGFEPGTKVAIGRTDREQIDACKR
ncbi:protein-glutamine glutaminase family protein [Streptomyces daliensis]